MRLRIADWGPVTTTPEHDRACLVDRRGEVGLRVARTWLLTVALVIAGSGPAAFAQSRHTVAVQVLPAGAGDEEPAARVQKITVDTLENYRNFITRRFLTDKDLKAQEEVKTLLEEGTRKVSTGMRSTVFDQGKAELDQAYLKVKGLLGEMEPSLVEKLYVGLAMAQAVLESPQLAEDYMLIALNLAPDRARQSLAYNKVFTDVFDRAQARLKGARTRVKITADPPGATITLDGRALGKSPLELDLAPGGHLVQLENEGYYRGGWIKDASRHGTEWNLSLKPIESRTRYENALADLAWLCSVDPAKPARKEPPDQAKVLETVRTILGADSILYICVGSAGNSMRLTGEFRSAWGSLSVNDEVPRDLNVVESVKGVVLKYTDVVKQKEEAKAAALQKEKDDYAAWVAGVTAALDLAERELMVRGRKWEIAGEAKKAELFGRTAGEVAALRQCAAAAEETRLADAEAGKKAFSGCTREWELLEPKVRSLLAWDVDAAVRAKEVREIEALSARAATGLAEVRKLFNEKKPLLAKPEAKRFGDEVKGLEKAMKEADKLGRKDPLSRERRRLLYKVLITEAELTRLLSLR